MTSRVPEPVCHLQGRKTTCGKNLVSQHLAMPAVVACGYRRIKIPKSGNSFPALLVAFEADAETNNIGTDRNPSLRGVRCAWRSKRDFLLLARKGVDTNEKSLPKAALKKVVDETAVPWRRSSSDITTAMEQSGTIPDCLCDEDLPNHYSVKMKKSIWQLDRFLQSMQSQAGNSEQRQNAWDLFCRHSDTEDIVTPQEFSASLSAKQDTNTNEKPSSDPVCTTASVDYTSSKTVGASTKTTLRESSRLGQYFASKENSRKVVECALEKILPLYLHRGSSKTKMIFVEPSCGHGDIVVSLIEALKEQEIPPEAVWIMGYDIDPSAIQTCRERQEFHSGAAEKFIDNDNENHNHKGSCSDYTVFWECTSFFETSRERCIHRFDKSLNNNKNNNNDDRDLLVCCLGGPPYTTGQGSGRAMKRDLPERFVDHCFNEWKAETISFLLPARYREDTQKILCDGSLEATKPQATDCRNNPNRWVRETRELEVSKFFFRGTTEVTQPSIIKLFYASQSGELSDDNLTDWMA